MILGTSIECLSTLHIRVPLAHHRRQLRPFPPMQVSVALDQRHAAPPQYAGWFHHAVVRRMRSFSHLQCPLRSHRRPRLPFQVRHQPVRFRHRQLTALKEKRRPPFTTLDTRFTATSFSVHSDACSTCLSLFRRFLRCFAMSLIWISPPKIAGHPHGRHRLMPSLDRGTGNHYGQTLQCQ